MRKELELAEADLQGACETLAALSALPTGLHVPMRASLNLAARGALRLADVLQANPLAAILSVEAAFAKALCARLASYATPADFVSAANRLLAMSYRLIAATIRAEDFTRPDPIPPPAAATFGGAHAPTPGAPAGSQ